jgi:hypothetical protein
VFAVASHIGSNPDSWEESGMGIIRFIRQYLAPVILAVFGVVFAGLDTVSRIEQIQAFGLPIWSLGPISSLCFLLAVLIFFYQVHKHIEAAGGTLQPVERRKRESGPDWSAFKQFGDEALALAYDLRDYLGPGYQYGLGLPAHGPSSDLRSRAWVLAAKMKENGIPVLDTLHGLKDPILYELLMRYFEYVGRFLHDNPKQAQAAATAIVAQLTDAARQSRKNPNFQE